MNKQTIITILLALGTTTSVLAQNLIKTATTPVSFSKRDFVDTIKIKVIDGAVVVPVEIEGRIRHFLFDTGSPLGLWQFPTIKMGNLQIENYPMIVEDAMSEFTCNRFDGVLGFNLVGKGLSFKLDTKDSPDGIEKTVRLKRTN